MRQVEENTKVGAEAEKSGDPGGSPASHPFVNPFKNHMAPKLALPPTSYLLPSYSALLFIAGYSVQALWSQGAGFVLGFNYLVAVRP